ncbi:lipocalin family protein [Salinimicrobium catena]|uniref:lipocalin family protein n=1 Tax=Salinimicrobium catena TaxID=390640 RepID=UPI002FE45ABE
MLEPKDGFYKDALTAATKQQLSGTWSIFEAAFEGETAQIPANYEECGRDFFQFTTTDTYRDHYYISSYECEKIVQDLNYELENGVITLKDDWGSSEEMVITQLTGDKLVFKMKIDLDDDGEPEVVSLMARRYTPPNDLDLYSYTFGSEITDDNRNEIKYTWQAYDGFYKFDRYEIYRSDTGCSKANARLVASITDSSRNYFIDLDPPVSGEICYFFKVYNEKGLLGESQLVNFFTEELRPPQMEFVNVAMQNNQVKLEWQPFSGNYFSHYEITIRNYKGGTGGAYQEYPVTTIEDPEVATFVDPTPPRLKDPVYAIYAYDIFGNVSSQTYTDSNAWELTWTHPEVLNFASVKFVAPAHDAPEVFFYGRQPDGQYQLIKYNYQDHAVSATAVRSPEAYTSIQMQVHTSENGTELFFAQGNTLAVYDAEDLSYKYKLNTPSFFDFAYLGNGIFSFTDSQTIYTYKRTNADLVLISQKSHFSTHFGNTYYHLLPLKNGEILVGHYQEPNSYKFTINAQGELSDGQPVNIPIRSRTEKKTLYSPDKDYVINLLDNKIFSTLTYSLEEYVESPSFPSGISRDGNLIFGTRNNPQEQISSESTHEKKARIYNLETKTVITVDTHGYPHMLFENHLGQIVSISSGFKRESLDGSAPKPDIFVEVLEL